MNEIASNLENTTNLTEITIASFIDISLSYAPKIILAFLVVFTGWIVTGWIAQMLRTALDKTKIDETIESFLFSFIKVALRILVIFSAVSILGVETSSFVAILASAGFAIGMALSGTLGNFASGLIILFFRPFRVGDYIDTDGTAGTVSGIQIFNTILRTPDNKIIVVPNSIITSNPMTNFSEQKERRVDFVFGIGYDDDIDTARQVIEDVLVGNDKILTKKGRESLIAIGELADSSVNFTVRVWAKTSDYWDVFFSTNEAIKKAFDANNISIPYPQQDIHIHK